MRRIVYLVAIISFFFSPGFSQKITLNPSMLTNITAKGNDEVLVDEQAAMDPKISAGIKPVSDRFTIEEPSGAINPLYLPMEVVIDLKRNYTLTDIYFYFLNGSTDSVFFYTGTPTNWGSSFLLAKPTNGYDTWRGYPVSVTTRYLKIKIKSTGVQLREIMLYGTTIETEVPDPLPAGQIPLRKRIWDFAGSNIFEDGWNDSILDVSGTHRIYYDLRWFDYDMTNPFPTNNYSYGKFDSGARTLDGFFKRWKDKGIHTLLTLKENSERFISDNGNAANSNIWKPISNNANAEDPLSYIEHADAMYQVAGRYGATIVPLSNLRVNTSVSPAKSGLDYINYIENGNENNKNWQDRKSYWTPYEYAAMSSADCDGHEGTMGINLGMKKADPTMKLVMAATISPDTAYIKAMAHWTKYFRTDKQFIWDVINIHHYSNDGGGQSGVFTTGVTPEQDDVYNKLKKTVQFCRKYWPEKEVWWSEFGYDLNSSSPQHTPVVTGQTAEQVQANLIVRCFLIGAAAGIDRMQQYMLRHSYFEASVGGLFNSSGLVNHGGYSSVTSSITPIVPHPSWYAMFTMRNTLKNYVFDKIEVSGDPNVYVYKFKHITATDSVAYALWCPTSNNTVVTNYSLAVPDLIAATKVNFLDLSKTGAESSLVVSNGNVVLDVSEAPAYVLGKITQTALGNKISNLSARLDADHVIALQWIVFDKGDLKNIQVEYSRDGFSFSGIGYLNARNGNFNFLDSTYYTASGNNYYRLKMFSADGKIQFSNIASIDMNELEATGFFKIVISPNPVEDKLTIAMEDSGCQIFIYNQMGSLLYKANDSEQTVDISTNTWPAGLYQICFFYKNAKIQTRKIVKL